MLRIGARAVERVNPERFPVPKADLAPSPDLARPEFADKSAFDPNLELLATELLKEC